MSIYHIVYQTTNKINNKIYIGVHSTSNINDGYLGSGVALKRAIKKYGEQNFEKTIIFCAFSRQDADYIESQIVSPQWLKENSKEIYNIAVGGSRGSNYLHLQDGEIKHITQGKVTALDKRTGETYQVPKDIFDIDDNLVGVTTGKAVYLDENGNKIICDTSSEMVATGRVKHHNSNKIQVVRNGNIISISKTEVQSNEQYADTLFKQHTVRCRDINTDEMKIVSKEEFDSSPDLVGVTYQTALYVNDKGETRMLTSNDPLVLNGIFYSKAKGFTHYRLLSGETIYCHTSNKPDGAVGITKGTTPVYDTHNKTYVNVTMQEYQENKSRYKRVNSGRKRYYSSSGEERLLLPTDDRVKIGEFKTRMEWTLLGNKNLPIRKVKS